MSRLPQLIRSNLREREKEKDRKVVVKFRERKKCDEGKRDFAVCNHDV